MVASPQTRVDCFDVTSCTPRRGSYSCIFPRENKFGDGAYEAATKGAVLFALRGRVTLDTKVKNATEGRAFAVIILDTTGDPIGPDLDQLASIVVGCVLKKDVDRLLAIISVADCSITGSLNPSSDCIGQLLSNNREALGMCSAQELLQFRDASGHSVLHYAAARDEASAVSEHILEFLLETFKLDLDVLDYVKGQTSLHIAANNGAARALSILCFRGARQIARTSDGRFPLHLAANEKHLSCLQVLDRAGCDLAQRASNGVTAMQLSSIKGCARCTRFFVQRGLDLTDCLPNAQGLARAYLEDVPAAELATFVSAEDHRYVAEIKATAESWLLADLAQFIYADIDVTVNGQCAARDEFISRYRQMSAACHLCAQQQASHHEQHAQTAADADNSKPSNTSTGGSSSTAAGRPSLIFLWHGCDRQILPEILQHGFKTSFANMTFNAFGVGIYFATDAKLSAYFLTRNVKEQAPRPPDPLTGRYTIVLACVLAGTVGVREALTGGNEAAKAKMKLDLKHPANRNAPVGCDSALSLSLSFSLACTYTTICFNSVGHRTD